MEKGFHLLGITQKPSLKAVSAALALNHVAPLQLRNPIKNLNIRTRFEVFTTYLYVTRDHEFRDGELFGSIQVSDYYGVLPDGWGELLNPGSGHVSLFDHDMRHSVTMKNNGRLEIGDPISRHSVPFSKSMRIIVVLYATTKDNGELFEVCNLDKDLEFSSFLDKHSESISCECLVAAGNDGHMQMHYILLRDAVDATIKVDWVGVSGRKVCGQILAYYEKLDCGDENFVESFYKASLFETFGSEGLEDGDLRLKGSILAVPNKGRLVIEADIIDFDSGEDIVHDICVFESQYEGSFKEYIRGKDSTLEVEITWSRD